MRVLFVYSFEWINSVMKPMTTPEYIQLGVSYISSVLKQNDHETELVVVSSMNHRAATDMLDKYLQEYKPGMVAFSAVFSQYAFADYLAKHVKKINSDIFTIIGGPHISLNPETVLESNFDAACVGEGEYPTLELANDLDSGKEPTGIKNLWIKKGADLERNDTRPFIKNLDEIPFPDIDIWMPWIEEEPNARFSVLPGRGCPFNCAYCSNHGLRGLAKGKYVRFRSPRNIIAEIKELHSRYPDKQEYYLEVEAISIDMDWALRLVSELAEYNASLSKPLSWGTNIRVTPNIDFKELFECFNKANFRHINIGLESGSERVRKDILRRNYSNQDVLKTVELARKHDLKVCLYNLIGLPGETEADFLETVEINRKCQPDWHFTSIFFPYPGTNLYKKCIEMNLIKDELDVRRERSQAVLDMPNFTKKRILHQYIFFDYNVYKGKKSTFKLIIKTVFRQLKYIPVLGDIVSLVAKNPIIQKLNKMISYSSQT